MAGNLQLLDAVRLGQAQEVQLLIAEGADVSFREIATGFLPLPHKIAGQTSPSIHPAIGNSNAPRDFLP